MGLEFKVSMEDLMKSRKYDMMTQILDAYKKGAKNGMERLQVLTWNYYNKCLLEYGLSDGNIAQQSYINSYDNGFEIGTTADEAIFVEFGTGFKGSLDPHPNPPDNWKYMSGRVSGRMGERGWYYPTNTNDPNPFKHEYNGLIYGWTRGLPSRPFLYKTMVYIKRYGFRTVNYYIKKELNALGGVLN